MLVNSVIDIFFSLDTVDVAIRGSMIASTMNMDSPCFEPSRICLNADALSAACYQSKDWARALVYLELATRAGETAASHVRDVIVESLPPERREQALQSVDKWKPLQFHRRVHKTNC